MMRKYFLIVAVALGSAGLGYASPSSAPDFIFTSVATNQSGIAQSFLSVATSGTNFLCVGSNSTAALAFTTNALAAGGYLTNAAAWISTAPGVSNLNCVAYGNGYYLAAGKGSQFVALPGNGAGVWTAPTNISGSVDAMGIAFDPLGRHFVMGIASPNIYYSTSSVPQVAWAAGMLDFPSPFESFRSVTAMSSNRFAICGIRGDIRLSSVSTNSLSEWIINRQIDLTQPDLHGIASDGSNTLVCVGLTSNILVSLDQGLTWFTNSTPDGAAINQAVTYTGSKDNRFIVVGANGRIYITSNNTNNLPWSWTKVSAVTNLTSQTLNAVAYATNGPLQGLAFAVGNAGTILVGGAVPAAPIPSNYPTTITNLLTYPTQTNIAFVATNSPDYYHPLGSVTNDWYGSLGGNDLLTSNSPNYTATNRLCGTNSFWVQSRDIRTGLTSTNRTQFNVVILPAAPTTNGAITITNLLTVSPQVNGPESVNILTNSDNPPSNFVVNWYDAATAGTLLNNGTETNLGRAFYHTPTNAVLSGIYTNWTLTVATNTTPAGVNVSSTNRTSVVYVVIPPAPINALAGLTNVLTTNNSVWVDVLTNMVNPASTFTLAWYDASTGGNLLNYGTETNLSNRFFYTPTNRVSGVYTVYAQTVATNTAYNGGSQISTNRTAVTYAVIPPAPYAPIGGTNWENNLPNPVLSVSQLTNTDNPSGRILGDWYTSIGGTLLATATNSYTPTVTARGAYTYWVQARDMVSNLVSTNWLAVRFLVVAKPVITNGPIALEVTSLTNLLTWPLQTNATLTKYLPDESLLLTNLPAGAGVTVDWYTDSLGLNPAYSGTNSADTNWFDGGGVVLASGTTNFIATNRLAGTYTYWAQARVTNPGFNTPGLSTNLQPFVFTLIPQAPLGGVTGFTNVLTLEPQVNLPVWVNILTNFDNPPANFVVDWYDAAANGNLLNNNEETNLADRFFHGLTNVTSGVYTIYAETRATNASPAGTNMTSTNRTPVTFVLIPPAPSNVQLYWTNVLTVNNPLWVEVLTNLHNSADSFKVEWYDAPTGGNNLGTATNVADFFYYTPTNVVCGIYTVYGATVATNTPDGSLQISTNRILLTYVVVPPAPTNPLGATNWEDNLPNPPLSVSVYNDADNPPGRITVDWYDNSKVLVAPGVTNFAPTNTLASSYQYSAVARDVNSGLISTNNVFASLVLQTYVPKITLLAGVGDIKWVGAYTLQYTTNLTPPVHWVDVTNGVSGTNDWIYTTTNADATYYHLKPN